MAQYRIPHPYDARFALPTNVMAEPPGRGTYVTEQRPRKSFDAPGYIPPSWSAHFDLPGYVRDEPVGRGSMHTYWARRKTIPMYIPDALGNYESDLGRTDSLRLAAITSGMMSLAQGAWTAVGPLLFLDPKIGSTVRVRGTIEVPSPSRYKVTGTLDPQILAAFRKTIQIIFKMTSMSYRSKLEYVLKGKLAVAKAKLPSGKTVAIYAKRYPGGLEFELRKPAAGIGSLITWPVKKLAEGVKAVADKVGDFIKSLTCKITDTEMASTAAAMAAAYYGAPPQVGSEAHRLANEKICGKPPEPEPEQPFPPPTGGKSWLLPVGIGVAGLATIYLLTRGDK